MNPIYMYIYWYYIDFVNAFKVTYIYIYLLFLYQKRIKMEYGKHADKEKIIKKSQYCFWSGHTSMAICQLS